MFIDVEAGGGERGANATADIDPVFSFAPGVDPAYSFRFSDRIGNSPIQAIPEPASVVLLSTGAIAIGLLRRRSRLRPLAMRGAPVRSSLECCTGVRGSG